MKRTRRILRKLNIKRRLGQMLSLLVCYVLVFNYTSIYAIEIMILNNMNNTNEYQISAL